MSTHNTQGGIARWVKAKPDFNEECLLITASWISRHECYHYNFFQIIKLNDGEAWYWAIVCDDGNEWGDLADLKADLYLTLPRLSQLDESPLPASPEGTEDWKLKGHSYQIADTGDYDGHWEITNGKISLLSKLDDEEVLQPVVDALNNSGAKFYMDDAAEFECSILKQEVKQLQDSIQPIQQENNGYKEWHEDVQRICREIDVTLFGEEGASKQPSLCDIQKSVERLKQDNEMLKEELEDSITFSKKAIEIATDEMAKLKSQLAEAREALVWIKNETMRPVYDFSVSELEETIQSVHKAASSALK